MSKWVKSYDVTDWPRWRIEWFIWWPRLLPLVVFLLTLWILKVAA